MDTKQKLFEPSLELHTSMEFDHLNGQRPEKELAVATDIFKISQTNSVV